MVRCSQKRYISGYKVRKTEDIIQVSCLSVKPHVQLQLQSVDHLVYSKVAKKMCSNGFLVLLFGFCCVKLSVGELDEGKSFLRTKADTTLPYVAIDSEVVITCSAVEGTKDSIPVQNVRWRGPNDTKIEWSASEYISAPIFQYMDHFRSSKTMSVKITAVDEDQGGVYKCLGNQGDTLLETAVELVPYFDFAIPSCSYKGVIKVVKGTEDDIQCSVTGKKLPNITWYKNGALYVPDSNRCRIDPANVIKCNPVIDSDAGNYTISGWISSPIKKVINETFTVVVWSEPHIQNLTTEIQVAEHGTVRLTCSATGVPTPTYKWLDPNLNEFKNQIGYQVSMHSGILVINEAYPHDSGLLTCVAKNNVGTAQRKVKLIVTTQPEVETTSPSLEQVTSSDLGLVDCVWKTHETSRSLWKMILGLVVTVSILIVIFIVDTSCYVTKRRGLLALLVLHSWKGGESTNGRREKVAEYKNKNNVEIII